jgi:hypothetical protein
MISPIRLSFYLAKSFAQPIHARTTRIPPAKDSGGSPPGSVLLS